MFIAMNFTEDLSKFEPDSKEYKFFEKVLEKVGKNFIRKSVEQDVKEAQNKLNKAMQKYFEMHILANAVIKSVEQDEMSLRTCSGSCNDVFNKFKSSSNNMNFFYLNLVKKYLPPDETSEELKLFGLNQKDVLQASKTQQKPEFEYTMFKKLVEDNINSFCIKLIECTGGTVVPGRNWKNTFDKTMKDLESKAAYLSNEDTKEQSKNQLRAMIKTYYEELTKGVSLLSKLLSLYEQKLEFESDVAEFYRQRCYAVYLKIRVFELKILEATYSEETIPALKKISSHLDITEKKLKEEQNEKTVALESYLKLGEEYESFVDEYTHLTKSIREQKWAIEELKSQKLQYERNS